VLRSPLPHASIGEIDTRRALDAPALLNLTLLSGEDLRPACGLGTLMRKSSRGACR